MTTLISTRRYSATAGHGWFRRRFIVTVQCQEQHGKFYASVITMNASFVGAGDTEEEAYNAWAKEWRATAVKESHS